MTESNQNQHLPYPPEKRTRVAHFYMEPKGRFKVLNTVCGSGGEQEARAPEKPLKLYNSTELQSDDISSEIRTHDDSNRFVVKAISFLSGSVPGKYSYGTTPATEVNAENEEHGLPGKKRGCISI